MNQNSSNTPTGQRTDTITRRPEFPQVCARARAENNKVMPSPNSPMMLFGIQHKLTPEEIRLLHARAVDGAGDRQAARMLTVSMPKVALLWHRLRRKTGHQNRTALLAAAWRLYLDNGLLTTQRQPPRQNVRQQSGTVVTNSDNTSKSPLGNA